MKHQILEMGLTTQQAEKNKAFYGNNALEEKQRDGLFMVFVKQFKSPLVYTLLVVAVITFFLKDYSDAVVVMVVVSLNALLGTFQNRRTNNTLDALKKLSKPFSHVFRDGKLIKTHTENITIDDVVFLEPGDIVPADAVILTSSELQINESQLTGESLPLFKEEQETVFKGSIVYSGSATGRVIAIGSQTEIGKLSDQVLTTFGQETYLEKQIRKLVRFILITVSLLSIFLLGISIIQGTDIVAVLKTIVALAVSAIPEGLPVVLTLVLALGAWRLSQAKSLLKNLPSGASLAMVSFVCTDKTGTLTRGDIVLEKIIPLHSFKNQNINKYVLGSLDIKNIGGEVVGDILDKKIYEKLEKENLWIEETESPFTSENKFNAKEYKTDQGYLHLYKGAPELFSIDPVLYEPYVQEGKRVLAVGISEHRTQQKFSVAHAHPVALLVFNDELRPDVAHAITNLKKTGIQVMLITGDNILTATTIAKKVGILIHEKTDIALEGKNIDNLSDEALQACVQKIKVIARARPDHKVRIVRALQSLGEVVAMTGDGVNDGPALSLADIGIAMGKSGTEVAKEASDLILVDDNFSSIVQGIFEARVIIENIKKTVIFLFSTALGEIIIISGTIILGLPIALLPAQILWLNLITDGFLDMAIASEPAEDHVKQEHFTRYRGNILNRYDYTRVIIMGMTMGIVSLGAFVYLLDYLVIEIARTVMLVIMSIFQWFNVFNVRKHFKSIFTYNIFSNIFISVALVIEMILLVGSVYSSLGNRFLFTLAIAPKFWIIAGLLAVTIIITDTLYKWYHQKQWVYKNSTY